MEPKELPKELMIAPGLQALPADLAHAEPLAALVRRNIEHLRRYLPPVAALSTTEDARSHLIDVAQQVARGELLEWYVFAEGVLCGGLRLNHFEPENQKASVAYFLGAGHQGRGIATAAARAAIGFGFESLGLHRVELRCVTTNHASIRVAERLKFVREGELRDAERLNGSYVNHYVYGLLRAEFCPGP
jgi:ribosomal-protein-serine acetyltransferase